MNWQRCQSHFLRNIYSPVHRNNSKTFRESVKVIFHLTDIERIRTAKYTVITKCINRLKYTTACEIFGHGFEDAFQHIIAGNNYR